MDFFDPVKQKQHATRLLIGYALIGATVVLATIILLYQARGFWLDKEGRIIQNGLVFVGSRPRGAQVYLNGVKNKNRTNARLNLPSGQYLLELKRDGYRDWKRILTVEGGDVERFEYPLLLPTKLEPTTLRRYAGAPTFSTSSPDRRWLLVATAEKNTFELFDLTTDKLTPISLEVADDILAAGSTTTGWQAVEWSKDNRHVVLKRLFSRLGQTGAEYILLDREDAAAAQNLSVAFGFTPDKLELRDRAFDRYYLYDRSNGQLFTASLASPTPQPYLSDVLAFTTEKDIIVYATADGALHNKVLIRLQRGNDHPFTVRQVPANSAYRLGMGVYENKLYLAAGAASDNRIAVYRDPLKALERRPDEPLAPVHILKVANPKVVLFSPTDRLVMAENADQFAVYDAETDRGYAYRTDRPLDKPQTRASWLDNFRLSYTNGGQALMFDFDGTNLQTLLAASPAYPLVVDPDYRFMGVISPQQALLQVPLLTPQDH